MFLRLQWRAKWFAVLVLLCTVSARCCNSGRHITEPRLLLASPVHPHWGSPGPATLHPWLCCIWNLQRNCQIRPKWRLAYKTPNPSLETQLTTLMPNGRVRLAKCRFLSMLASRVACCLFCLSSTDMKYDTGSLGLSVVVADHVFFNTWIQFLDN